jgi:hypothetical protein
MPVFRFHSLYEAPVICFLKPLTRHYSFSKFQCIFLRSGSPDSGQAGLVLIGHKIGFNIKNLDL